MNTFRRLSALALIFSLVSATAFAAPAPGIRESAAAAATAAAKAQEGPASFSNPYLWPSLGLMSGGVAMAILGFASTSGVDCKSTDNGFGVSCGTSSNKGLVIAGAGVAALGGYLFYRGEQSKKARRSVTFIAPLKGGVVVGQRLSF